MPASGPATSKEPAAAGPVGSRSARYVFPVRGCRVSYGHSHSYYPATDIFTDPGCAFVAPLTALSTRSAGSIVGILGVTAVPTAAACRCQSSGSTASATTALTCSRSRRASPMAPAYAPGSSWAASTTPVTHGPPRPMFTLACPGRPHRVSGGSVAVWCPGPTWMPGVPVATSLQLRRSGPPTPPPAATSHPVASAARCCRSGEAGARLQHQHGYRDRRCRGDRRRRARRLRQSSCDGPARRHLPAKGGCLGVSGLQPLLLCRRRRSPAGGRSWRCDPAGSRSVAGGRGDLAAPPAGRRGRPQPAAAGPARRPGPPRGPGPPTV
jgi:hypothetical protein